MTEFTSCGVCGIDKKDMYTCPRCSFLYCSIKCYKNEKHSTCSEQFYKEHVKRELSGMKCDMSHKGEDYKEKMEKYLSGDWSGIEEGEPLDSDDEEEGGECSWEKDANEAMKRTVQGTVDDYELEDDEIERRMMAVGLSEDVDELLNTLTPEERETFRQLAQEMQNEELGLDQSCFK